MTFFVSGACSRCLLTYLIKKIFLGDTDPLEVKAHLYRTRIWIKFSLHCAISLTNWIVCLAIIYNMIQIPCKFLYRLNGALVVVAFLR